MLVTCTRCWSVSSTRRERSSGRERATTVRDVSSSSSWGRSEKEKKGTIRKMRRLRGGMR